MKKYIVALCLTIALTFVASTGVFLSNEKQDFSMISGEIIITPNGNLPGEH